MIRVALNTAAALGVLVGLMVAWQLRDAILIFGLSLALAAALRPPIEYLVRRGLPISLAVACTYLPVLMVLAIALLVPAAWLGFEFKQFADDAMRAYEHIDQWHHGNWFQREVVRILPPSEQAMEILSGDRGIEILATVAGVTFGAATVAFYALLVIVLSVYWSLDRVRLERLWLSLLSAILRGRTRQIWHSLESQVGSYLRSEFLQSLLAGLLLGVGYRLIGQPYPVLLALIGAVAWLVPWVGALFAVAALVVASLPSIVLDASWNSTLVLVSATIYTFLILLLLELVVEPHLFNRPHYSMILIALVAIGLATVWGVFGLLLGPPVAVGLQVLAGHLFRGELGLSDGQAAPTLPDLVARTASLRGSLAKVESPSPKLMSLMDRLDGILQKVPPSLHNE